MNEQNIKPDFSEQYAVAIHTSNLKVDMDSERRSNADVLMAAAWSPQRLGSALLRLHSEWDSAEKPRKPTEAAIKSLVGTKQCLPQGVRPEPNKDGDEVISTIRRAAVFADAWHRHEVAMLLGRLKTLPEVRYQLEMVADKWGYDNPKHVTASVVKWWMDRNCPTCHGVKFEVIEGTGRQSAKLCKSCRGTGEAPIPCGDLGRFMANFIDDCLNRARQSIKHRLRPQKVI
jgi:hypothetical protein